MNEPMDYNTIIIKKEEDGSWTAFVKDVPSAFANEDSPQMALLAAENIAEFSEFLNAPLSEDIGEWNEFIEDNTNE